MRYILVLITFCLFTGPLLGQNKVQFINNSGFEPVTDVAVFNSDKTFTITSNSEGYIEIPSEVDGYEFLTIKHAAFLESEMIVKDMISRGKIILIPLVIEMEEFVVAASKSKERVEEVSNQIAVLKSDAVRLANPQTAADLLKETGSVYIQKSQMGGGSPVIRGFEANKVLIVVDGVRLNNAIYRGGHLQNVITIDPAILDRTEVVFGPGSLIYGSDAIGGVMHFVTKDPDFSKDEGLAASLNSTLRYATVNKEKTAHVDFSLGKRNFASLTSISFSDFDDLHIGKVRPEEHGSWGQAPFVVTVEDGIDRIVANEDENVLTPTGYSQVDVLQKFVWRVNPSNKITANLQYSTSSNIPRFDKMNDYVEVNGGSSRILKWARWDYGPQTRMLASLAHRYTSNENRLFDQINTTAAFQRIEEDRIKRKFGSIETTNNEEDVLVYSFNVDASKSLGAKSILLYGLELTHNEVTSTAYLSDPGEGQIDEFVLTRYPDAGSSMQNESIYLKHKWKVNDKITFTQGLRFAMIQLNAAFSDQVTDLSQKEFSGNYEAVTGGMGVAIKATPVTRISANVGTGFRAPNIDDSGKFFDPQDEMVVVPNFDIKPEYVINGDIALDHKIGSLAKVHIDGYYNYLFNAIVRRTDQLNGLDSIDYDGTKSAVFTNQNAGRAMVSGFSIGLESKLYRDLSLFYNHNFVIGKDLTEAVPLGHIPPQYGQGGLQWISDGLQLKLFCDYNANKSIELYSPFGEDKESEALETGTPAWYTVNFKAGIPVSNMLHLSVGVENIFDVHYKPFSSGISGPGRNFILALRTGLR